jgi:hypothetical protein
VYDTLYNTLMLSKNWWQNPAEVFRVEWMLVRANVLPEVERSYFRSRPEKWQKEAEFADKQEALMTEAGVDPTRGWRLTAIELMAELQQPASARARARAR